MVIVNRELETFIDETIRLSFKNSYTPTIFLSMRQRHGTIGAISKLVQSGDIQSGFKKLNELGLLDWTIEAAIIKFPEEFTKSDIECAEFRLRLAREAN